MRRISVTKKEVKATLPLSGKPAKAKKIKADRYLEVCRNCTKPNCKKGYCELTGGR